MNTYILSFTTPDGIISNTITCTGSNHRTCAAKAFQYIRKLYTDAGISIDIIKFDVISEETNETKQYEGHRTKLKIPLIMHNEYTATQMQYNYIYNIVIVT
jgi:hypothetical protein